MGVQILALSAALGLSQVDDTLDTNATSASVQRLKKRRELYWITAP